MGSDENLRAFANARVLALAGSKFKVQGAGLQGVVAGFSVTYGLIDPMILNPGFRILDFPHLRDAREKY